MSRPNLPLCSWQNPSCGACGGETSHDGDAFYCDDCGLDYGDGADGTEATYRDEERPPCGAPCSGHLPLDGWRWECTPCRLPDTHTPLMHWHDCQPVSSAAATDGADR